MVLCVAVDHQRQHTESVHLRTYVDRGGSLAEHAGRS